MAREIKQRRLSDEQIQAAENVDILDYVQRAGYTPVKHGNKTYRLQEMDSLVIDPVKNSWKRYSEDVGGNVINFVEQFDKDNLSFPDAVKKLLSIYHPEMMKQEQPSRPSVRLQVEEARKMLGMDGKASSPARPTLEQSTKVSEKEKSSPNIKDVSNPAFSLPARNINNNRVTAYLCQNRGIDSQVVIDCLRKKIIYEDADHHNAVFVGFDKENNAMYAGLRGTYTKEGQPGFKGEVAGSNKSYSWAYTPTDKGIDTLFVYESPIDAMSHMTLHMMDGKDYRAAHRLSLGTVAFTALERYLADHSEIKKVGFYLDNDIAGRKKTAEFMERLQSKGYVCSCWQPDHTMTLCSFKNWPMIEKYLSENPGIKNISIQAKPDTDRSMVEDVVQKLQAKGYNCFKENKEPQKAKDINEMMQLKKTRFTIGKSQDKDV